MTDNYMEKIQHETNGFIQHNGIRIVLVSPQKSVLEAEVTDNCRNVWGNVHGGFLYAMADTAAGVFARINYDRRNVTLDGSINYLRSTQNSSKIVATCSKVKVGEHIGFFTVDITDDSNALIARAQMNMYFLR